MAGHSKWANIKRKKWAQDAKRSKLFTRLLREVTVAARLGDPDPDANPRLRNAIDEALANNVPKDRIERAVQKGAGELEGEDLEEIRYEGYGPGGVAIMVDCMTDNRNRTAGEVRYAFNRHGGNMGTDGSVAFMFAKRGYLLFDGGFDEDELMAAALEAGALELEQDDDGHYVLYTEPEQFYTVKSQLQEQGFQPSSAQVTMVPSNYVSVEGDDADKVGKLFDELENLGDVQNIYANVAFDEQ